MSAIPFPHPYPYMEPKRFRIAFSFTGEKRSFVAESAQLLAAQFGESSVLYDKYHEAEFARNDLGVYLPNLYHRDSDLVVVVVCPDYDKKEWPGLEWLAIHGLLQQRQRQEVLLCRFARAQVDGLFPGAGFIELDDKTPRQFVTHILERLALNEGHLKTHYTSAHPPAAPDWPEVSPPLDWQVADHTKAQTAFEQLITRASPFRLLPIQGVSDTGKSHLTKLFLRNALKIKELRTPELTCGRFDFKGSSDMDGELRSFAIRLGVAAPTPRSSISAQLGEILGSLRARAHPTLLIFDTFELAGETERWIRESLLVELLLSPWLRITIVGQEIPNLHGESWEHKSFRPIKLCLPTPEDWFLYAEPHKPGLTRAFVSLAHDYCNGKSSVLAELFRPA